MDAIADSLAMWLGRSLDLNTLGELRKLEQTEFFQCMLLECADATHLPEVCAVLGPETIVKFFDHFAGTTIKVPNRHQIEQAVRDTTIFFKLYNTRTGHKTELARELAAEFGLSAQTVFKIYLKLRRRYELQQKAMRELECLKSTMTNP